MPFGPPIDIQFVQTLRRLLTKIINSDPTYSPVLLVKVYLSNAYMRVWILTKDIPLLAFVILLYP